MNDTLHLCATTRLAQTLRAGVPGGQPAAWRTVRAMTIGQWLEELADEAQLCGVADLPGQLDATAERILWEQVIADALAAGASDAAPLFDLRGLAASAMDAHALCRSWQLTAGGQADEARLFAAWQAEFERRCRQAGWLDTGGVHRRLLALIEAGQFALPARIVLAGFDRLTPFEQQLAGALATRGCAVENAGYFAVDRSEVQLFACPDAVAECRAAVAWAADRLAAEGGCRIGIVAPDLASVRDTLACLLDDVLHPEALRPDAAELPRRFNFSLGQALADVPLVGVALDLLGLGNGRAKLEQTRLEALLLAGFWGGCDSEADGRAQLAAAMRGELPWLSTPYVLPRLADRVHAAGGAGCPLSMTAWAAGLTQLGEAPRSLRPGAWGRLFRAALAAFGWPGERALSSTEFQARRAFLEVLDGFGRLDGLLGPLSQPVALARLRELCRERLFQPETRGRPSIQVLGVLESAGLAFDALWVMGLNDDRWPPAPRPNPLLPAEVQRAAGSAHASAEVELDFARRVHARLLRAAPEVRLSFARADGNRLLRPSPLLADLPPAVDLDRPVATPAARLAAEPGWVMLADAQAPPVAAGEKVSGGSGLLRAQAICPAWAFYQFRLGAEALAKPVEGLDPASRGTLVHAVLEAFWQTVGDSRRLVALGETGRQAAVAAAVAQAIDAFEADLRSTLPARFRQLEAGRLCRLVARWLTVELARGQDFEVLACERRAEVTIEEIRVHMVVDRIDRLADGRQVIIDYKTGAGIDTKNWAGQRITEPQLPIYAALVNDEVAAVAFAKVLIDKPAFAGVAEEGQLLPGVTGLGEARQKVFDPAEFPDWIAVITHWRERLHAVAREVREGVAGVMVADESALRYCDVLPLLRLPERRRLLVEAGMLPEDRA